MKSGWGATAITLALGLAPAAYAQAGGDCPPTSDCPGPDGAAAPVFEIDEEDDAIAEIELQLNELLLVDESGRIVLREDVKAVLPPNVPLDRVQAMLGAFVELGEEGRIRFKDRQMIKPYLPMFRNFLGQGGLDQLRELRKLPPAEREEAMRRMLEERGMTPGPRPAPRAEPRPAPRAEPRPAPQPEPRPAPRAERDARPHAPSEHARSAEERLARIEEKVDRIEGMLERALREHGEGGRFSDGHHRRGLLDEFRRRMGGHDGDRPAFGMGLGESLERARTWRRGLQRLGQLMEPDDFDRLRRAMQRMDLQPGDLQDQGRLMEKAQQALDPDDMARFMEVFSDFMGTPEGRDLVREVERSVQRLEAFVNSERGRRTMERVQGLLERDGDGGLQGAREQLERLIQGRDRQPRERARGEDHHRRERRGARHERGERREVNPPPGSKLY